MEPFVAEIRMFGPSWAPRMFMLCAGQLLAVSQNDALFALLGTTYGGDGRTTFGLPDLRGRVPLHQGRGPGLSMRVLGQLGGAESVTLTQANLPSHTHSIMVSTTDAASTTFTGNVLAKQNIYEDPSGAAAVGEMRSNTIGLGGGNQPHENRMPINTISFIIATQGIFPSRH